MAQACNNCMTRIVDRQARSCCCSLVVLEHGIRLRSEGARYHVIARENSLYIDCMLFHRTVAKDCHHGLGNEKPLEGTQKALWALRGPSKGFMKPFKKLLGTPVLGGKRRVSLGKRALRDSLFGLCEK